MTVSADVLQGLMVAALMGTTGAGTDVFAPRTWPTQPPLTPVILVQSPSEHKQGLGRTGAPQFTCTTTIRVVARISGRETGADQVAMALLAALGVLQRQIEVAVINNYDLRRAIQQFASVEITNSVSRESEAPVGELVMDFSLEFYQGPEDFAANPVTPLDEMVIFGDLVNVFSATDVFAETPFAGQAVQPIRTQGPDGRAEFGFMFFQPQDLNFAISTDTGLLPGI